MFLIVGLGNPGAQYARTRHNVGFDVIEILAARNHIVLGKSACKARIGEGRLGSERIVLAQPQTYMNLSGESVVQLLNWYKPEPDQLIVIYDDVDLPFGRVRFRPSGSAGTHNGMRNIIYLLGRDDFPRLRVGTGRPPEGWDMKNFVLAGYQTPEERKVAFDAYLFAAETVETYVRLGLEKTRQFVSTQPKEQQSGKEDA